MGTQCSCSKSVASKQSQIEHNPQSTSNPAPQSPPETSMQLLEGPIQQQCNVPSAPDEAVASSRRVVEQTIQTESHLKQKTERKKQKKIAQVLIAPAQNSKEEINEEVKFIQKKQLSRNQTQLIIKTLKNHFILSQLSSQEMHYVLNKMRFCTIQKNNYVFKQGDPSFSYYVIIDGKCTVLINGQCKRVLEAGAAFGDLGIIYNAPRSASIMAETDCIFAELNSKTFRRIINDLNSIYQQSHKKMLQNLQFYNNLTEPQKNALATNCIVEVYQAGQVIFNKGDDANAFYLIREGIVTILEKNIDLKAGESVGVNAIISNAQSNAVRSNSLIAKTNCKLLSLTRDLILKNLGDNITNILRKNLVLKILKESDIWEMYSQDEWISILQKLTANAVNKGGFIFTKGTIVKPHTMFLILKADARSETNPKAQFYIANSIIEPNKVFKKQQFIFKQNFEACGDCELISLTLICKQKGGRADLSLKEQKIKLNLKDFIILRNLRSGNFGKVYACYNKITKQKYAIKVMNKDTLMCSNVLSYVEKETQLLATLPEHPFFIKYYDTFYHQNLILLTMALIEGQDLFDSLNIKLPLKQNDALFLISQLILVLQHLHNQKVIYRDLKPENAMLGLDGYLTLVDMGTAKKLTLQSRFKTSTIIGTPHYMAPQILLGKGYTFTADWWSLGIILYEMVTGKLPYGETSEDPFAVYQQIIKNELVISNMLTFPCQEVLQKLLTKSMPRRLRNGSSELKQMVFFKQMDWDRLLKKQIESKIYPSKSSFISQEEIERILVKKKNYSLMSAFLKGSQQNKILN